MTQSASCSKRYTHHAYSLDRVMQPEQFNQVLDAILAGKYSWACVLILRFAGYNPLHYIPYRTYNRIVKDNRDRGHSPHQDTQENPHQSPGCLKSLEDLGHLDRLARDQQKIQGGLRWLSRYF